MTVVNFYHLHQSGLEAAMLPLITRAMGAGWRVMLRGPDPAVLERLDVRLWQNPEEGFLPHGMEGGPHDADQPLLIGKGRAVNGAKAVMQLAGLPLDLEEARQMERVWLLFEEGDAQAVQIARGEWKAVVGSGLRAQYWSDASGRWEMKAESGSAA